MGDCPWGRGCNVLKSGHSTKRSVLGRRVCGGCALGNRSFHFQLSLSLSVCVSVSQGGGGAGTGPFTLTPPPLPSGNLVQECRTMGAEGASAKFA